MYLPLVHKMLMIETGNTGQSNYNELDNGT